MMSVTQAAIRSGSGLDSTSRKPADDLIAVDSLSCIHFQLLISDRRVRAS